MVSRPNDWKGAQWCAKWVRGWHSFFFRCLKKSKEGGKGFGDAEEGRQFHMGWLEAKETNIGELHCKQEMAE